MRLMLDSAFVIDLFNGHEGAVARHEAIFESGDDAMINEIVVCEVRAGMRSSEAWLLDTFLEPIEFLQPGPDAAIRAGVWRVDARARGRHLRAGDTIILGAMHGE